MAHIAIFDLDRTVTRYGTFTPFLLGTRRNALARAGLMARIAGSMLAHKMGRLTRRQLKDRMLAHTFAGRSKRDIERLADAFVERLLKQGVRSGALKAIEAHREAGDILVLATAAMDFYAARIAERLGFDIVVATGTEWRLRHDGTHLPVLATENCYGAEKLARLREALKAHHDKDDTELSFYSDHHTDEPVFDWVHRPAAVSPNRKLKALARRRGMKVLEW